MNVSTIGGKTFLVVGATSAMATELIRRLAARRVGFVLAARDTDRLARIKADIETRYGVSCQTLTFDALDRATVGGVFQQAVETVPSGIDGVIVCHGFTPNEAAPLSESQVHDTFEINLISTVTILEQAARYLSEKGGGMIAAISSVAGDRGRQSNYIYGASKAGLTTFLEGLRNRLQRRDVHVLTIKPGFVDTPMTRGFKAPPSFLVATPARIAADIERAMLRRQNVVYTPWFWRWIMTIICLIPEPIFKRMKL